MEKMILKPYTKEETKKIIEICQPNASTTKEKEEYALSIDRTVTQITSKASYEKNKKKYKKKQRRLELVAEKAQKPATLNITHVDKIISTKEATITIGEAVITIPFRTFQINGVKIDW